MSKFMINLQENYIFLADGKITKYQPHSCRTLGESLVYVGYL